MAKPGRKSKLPPGVYRRGAFLWIRYTDVVDGIRKQICQSTGLTEETGEDLKKDSNGKYINPNINIAVDMLQKRTTEAKARLNPELAGYDTVKRQFTYHKFLSEVYFKSDISKTSNYTHVQNCLMDAAGTFGDKPRTLPEPVLGNKKMGDIAVSDLIAWSNYQSTVRGNSKSTRNRHRAYLRKSLKYAVSMGYYEKSKLREILDDDTYVQLPEPKHPRRAFTHRQLEVIIDTASQLYPHVHEIIQVAVLTGWRQGRIYGLRWRDVDFERMLIIIPPKSEADGGYTDHHISDPLKEILDDRFKLKRNPYVFYNPKTNSKWNDLSYAWSMILHKAGIRQHPDTKFLAAENRRREKQGLKLLESKVDADIPLEAFFHALRHTFASSLLDNGVDILIIQKLLNHKHLSTTQKYLSSLKKVSDYSEVLDQLGDLVYPKEELPDWYYPDDPDMPHPDVIRAELRQDRLRAKREDKKAAEDLAKYEAFCKAMDEKQ